VVHFALSGIPLGVSFLLRLLIELALFRPLLSLIGRDSRTDMAV
jgi:hypothetical protein